MPQSLIALALVVLVTGCGSSDSSEDNRRAGPTCNCQPNEVCCSNFGFCCPSDRPYGCAGGQCFVTPPVCIPHGYEFCG